MIIITENAWEKPKRKQVNKSYHPLPTKKKKKNDHDPRLNECWGNYPSSDQKYKPNELF